jgi:hypothetical protein
MSLNVKQEKGLDYLSQDYREVNQDLASIPGSQYLDEAQPQLTRGVLVWCMW